MAKGSEAMRCSYSGPCWCASRIVAIEPPAHLIADELALYHDLRWERILAEFPQPATARLYDVPSLFERIGFSGTATVLFGTRCRSDLADSVSLDVIHAQRLALSPRVVLCPFPELGQGLLRAMIQGGDAERVLSSWFFDDHGPTVAVSDLHIYESKYKIKDKLIYNFRVSICNAEDSRGYDRTSGNFAYAAVGSVNPRAHQGVDNEWRRWIAENLMLGGLPRNLEAKMVEKGCPEAEAALEVKNALESPYFRGARRLINRFAKRCWILDSYRKLSRLGARSAKIDRRQPPTRGEFFDGYYTANLPVIITGMMDDWRSRNERQLEDVARRLATLPGDAEKLIDEDDWKEQLSEATDDLPPFREYLGAEPRGRHDPAQSRRHEQPFPAESGERLAGPGDR